MTKFTRTSLALRESKSKREISGESCSTAEKTTKTTPFGNSAEFTESRIGRVESLFFENTETDLRERERERTRTKEIHTNLRELRLEKEREIVFDFRSRGVLLGCDEVHE